MIFSVIGPGDAFRDQTIPPKIALVVMEDDQSSTGKQPVFQWQEVPGDHSDCVAVCAAVAQALRNALIPSVIP